MKHHATLSHRLGSVSLTLIALYMLFVLADFYFEYIPELIRNMAAVSVASSFIVAILGLITAIVSARKGGNSVLSFPGFRLNAIIVSAFVLMLVLFIAFAPKLPF